MTIPKRRVAVIGGGVSGVSAAIHMKTAGLDVTLFERSPSYGGVWVFNDNIPPEPAYPSAIPSTSDFTALYDQDEWQKKEPLNSMVPPESWHSPPGPAYHQLSNNVPTQLMELKANAWKPDTPGIVRHHVLAEYIQDTAFKRDLDDITQFNTRVDLVEKVGLIWQVKTTTLSNGKKVSNVWKFDRVTVATGHYHACRIPGIPGLEALKAKHPTKVQHSKSYRYAAPFKDKTVLLVGASVSSTDIAKELGVIAKRVYQTSRAGIFDLPESWLPENASRVANVASFDTTNDERPGMVTLTDGIVLHDIDHVILCTGYHMTFPFLPTLHNDGWRPEEADDKVIVTDGTQTHNLHLDLFYIPDPTLAFIGVPYHVATFSLFEYQAIAAAAVFSNKARLPDEETMRALYDEKLRLKGAGKKFHSLATDDGEVRYVRDLVDWLNSNRCNEDRISGHTEEWIAEKKRLVALKTQSLTNNSKQP